MKISRFFHVFLAICLTIGAFAFTPTTPALAAGITVNTYTDENNTGANCSLREAITAANTNGTYGGCPAGSGAEDIITLPAGTYTLTGELPTVTSTITINGNGAATTIVQANAAQNTANYRVIAVDTTGNLTINGLTIKHGKCSIANQCSLIGAALGGGAVSNVGTLTILNSAITNNNSYVGAVYSNGTLTIKNTTFASNEGNFGGGIYTASAAATTTISNSTFFGNTASNQGGAIINSGTMTLVNNTFSANTSPLGAGVYNNASATLNMTNNILANSITGTDCYNNGGDTIATNVSNLIETNGATGHMCGTPTYSADPALDTALASNGGSTQTLALFSQSLAIDAGDAAACADINTVNGLDQRGIARTAGSGCDLGAFEAVTQNGTALRVNTNDDNDDGSCDFFVSGSKDCSLREAINAANTQAGTQDITFDDDYTITLSSALPAFSSTMNISDANAGVIIQASSCDPIPNSCSPAGYDIFALSTGGVTVTLDGLTLRYAAHAIYHSDGNFIVRNSTLTNNKASGPAITILGSAQAMIENSSLINNAGADGGAINLQGSSSMTIVNSAISGNTATWDGAIQNSSSGMVTIYNSAITNNSAQLSSSGIGVGNFTLYNTIIAGNTTTGTATQCTGTITADAYNMDSDGTCGGATQQTLVQLNLGPLQNNGGLTQTHALLPGSTAIDAGDDAICAGSPVNNNSQNGATRPQGSHCDVGSFEYDPSPFALSITRASADPTSAASVDFTVTFSETVTGVDTGDFSVTATGVSGATVSGVSGSGATRTVTVNTGSGNGTIRLDLKASGTGITDGGGNPISGGFTSGETYTVGKMLTVKSVGANDGWILESTETSAKGGTMNSSATTFNLGDGIGDKQYRAILSFDTSSLPDTAVITKVTLKIKKQGLVGADPFASLGLLRVDIRKPFFGSAVGLALTDFQAAAGKSNIGSFSNTPVSNWYTKIWSTNTFFSFVNLTGTTEFRLRFATDDNDNGAANYLKFYSGNAGASVRPTLIIEYYVP